MTESNPPAPAYIYKILPASAAPPDPLPERLPVSDLDEASGFIHLSTASQVPQTLKLLFSNDTEIYLLRLALSDVQEHIKWENSQGEQGEIGVEGFFPHLYNYFKLGKSEIDSVAAVQRVDGTNWDEALARSAEWLKYY